MERKWTEHHKITFLNSDGTADYVWEADIPMREIIIDDPLPLFPMSSDTKEKSEEN